MSDFDTLINRHGTDAVKWDMSKDALPMWVADMDFPVAPAIQKAIVERAKHPIYGYTLVPEGWHDSYIGFWKDRFGYAIEKEWLTFSIGIIPSLSTSVREFTEVGDEILILTPVYHVFNHSIENNARIVLDCPLVYKDHRYEIDFANLEEKMSHPRCTMMILCNPHNPVGRLWTKEELSRIAELAEKHHVLVFSDEVHGPITRPGHPYVPYASVSGKASQNSITAVAPTKSFNVAGIQSSATIVPNGKIRARLEFALNKDEAMEGNVFSYLVAIASFRDSRDWLDEMNAYVQKNFEYLRESLPKPVKVIDLEATYLAWVDLRALLEDERVFVDELESHYGIKVTPGSTFGANGKGFLRINLACPRPTLEKAVARLSQAIADLKEKRH